MTGDIFFYLFTGLLALLSFLLGPSQVFAHCPLCTVGAGAAALGASWLGVDNAAVGMFLGAFAFALGWWIGKLLKRRYIKYQNFFLALFSYIATVLPLKGMFSGYTSFNLYLGGEYGSLLNRTYLINKFLVGSLLGAFLVLVAPFLSRQFSKLNKGKLFPFQGTIITFLLLVLAFVIIQFLL